MPRRFLCLQGDGIGPEIMAATKQVLAAAAPLLAEEVILEDAVIGLTALAAHGATIPDEVIAAAKAADGVVLGPVSHNDYPPVAEGGLNPSGVLRKALDLHANIRPARSHDGLPHPIRHPLDLVVMRENLEGFYADRNMFDGNGEFSPVDGVALAVRRITRQASHNIATTAFEGARRRSARRVTAIHKANVMRMSDGLFLEAVRGVAAQHPDIAYDEMLVDAAAARMVRDTGRFDVVVTTNMFGDILSDLASELSGSLGLAGSLNVGTRHAAALKRGAQFSAEYVQSHGRPPSELADAVHALVHCRVPPTRLCINNSWSLWMASLLPRSLLDAAVQSQFG